MRLVHICWKCVEGREIGANWVVWILHKQGGVNVILPPERWLKAKDTFFALFDYSQFPTISPIYAGKAFIARLTFSLNPGHIILNIRDTFAAPSP
jgi:hypothetical protein